MNPAESARLLRPARIVPAGLVLGGLFVWYFDRLTNARPLQGWLFFKLARIWFYCGFLTLACASFGLWFVTRVCQQRGLSLLEKLAYALPTGLVGFVVGMYLGGFCGLYGPRFAIAMPAFLLLVGARCSLQTLRSASRPRAPGLLAVAAASFGVGCIGILYLGLLTPDAVNYDASWNHLVIAQDYARAGRIVPENGDWVKNVPHLGSIVNTWAFLVPGLDEAPLRWMQALHEEFTVFLWTLVGCAAAVRFFAGRSTTPAGWVAMFLFPSLFVYDGNMGAAADHYLAVFAAPIVMAGIRLSEATTWRRAVLFGCLAGGGLLTKLHAVYLLLPLSGIIAVRVVWLFVQRLRQPSDRRAMRALGALAAGALTAIALVSLHFGKNAWFYHNPFYPLAQGLIPSTPTLPDAQLQMDYLFADWHWHTPKLLRERVHQAAMIVFTFSFLPHYTFLGDVPTFGSLFTLLSPLLLFLRNARRLALGLLVTVGAVFTWAMTFWVDRNLQTFLPALAAVTGALIVRGWELGPFVRMPLIALIALQIVWGGDYYFSGSERISSSISLIKSSIDGRAQERFAGYRREYRQLGEALPANAQVMLHNNHVMLGIDRPVLLDWAGYQGVFDYRQYRTPRQLYDRLKQLGMTHVVYVPGSRNAPTKQEEVIFAMFATMHRDDTRSFNQLRLFPVGERPDEPARPISVVCWHVRNYDTGLYAIEALSSNEEMPPDLQQHPPPREAPSESDAAAVAAMIDQADAFISNTDALPHNVRNALAEKFMRAQSHSSLSLYLRKQPGLTSIH
jgi:hypothetical protein